MTRATPSFGSMQISNSKDEHLRAKNYGPPARMLRIERIARSILGEKRSGFSL